MRHTTLYFPWRRGWRVYLGIRGPRFKSRSRKGHVFSLITRSPPHLFLSPPSVSRIPPQSHVSNHTNSLPRVPSSSCLLVTSPPLPLPSFVSRIPPQGHPSPHTPKVPSAPCLLVPSPLISSSPSVSRIPRQGQPSPHTPSILSSPCLLVPFPISSVCLHPCLEFFPIFSLLTRRLPTSSFRLHPCPEFLPKVIHLLTHPAYPASFLLPVSSFLSHLILSSPSVPRILPQGRPSAHTPSLPSPTSALVWSRPGTPSA